jgi:hypothetical protein
MDCSSRHTVKLKKSVANATVRHDCLNFDDRTVLFAQEEQVLKGNIPKFLAFQELLRSGFQKACMSGCSAPSLRRHVLKHNPPRERRRTRPGDSSLSGSGASELPEFGLT